MKTFWGALSLVLALVVGQRVEAAGDGVEIVLQPQPGIQAMRLHLEQGAAPNHACTGPCVLRVSPGPYQLDVTDEHGESKARSLDLVSNESIAVAPPRHRLATAGAVMAVTGLVVAGVSGAIFGYGVIEDFRAWSCDSCGTVSRETVVISATAFTAGVVVGVVGALVALAASRPTVTERSE